MDLGEFLLARIAEDEAVARAVASPGAWVAVRADLRGNRPTAADVARVEGGDEYGPDWVTLDGDGLGSTEMANAEHIARHDPVRVLAECEAKRRIVAEHSRGEYLSEAHCECCCSTSEATGEPWGEWPCQTLRLLAAPYASHPDFRPEWSALADA